MMKGHKMNIKDIDDVVDVLIGMENKIKHIKALLKTKDEQILTICNGLTNLKELVENNNDNLAKKIMEENSLIDLCANKVIELVNKYHYLVGEDGVGKDNEYFKDDVKRILAKYINLNN